MVFNLTDETLAVLGMNRIATITVLDDDESPDLESEGREGKAFVVI